MFNRAFQGIMEKNHVSGLKNLRFHSLYKQEYIEELKTSLNIADETFENFSQPVTLTLDEHYFYSNLRRIQGIFVLWHLIDNHLSLNEIQKEIQKLKELGIIGISIEAPWNRVEIRDNKFTYPEIIDQIVEEAKKEGLWITILLSPHETPLWVFEKYGNKVKLKDKNGYVLESSNFMRFSIFSPAVDEQIRFQRNAVDYYSKFPNVLAFFLTNEPGYSPWTTPDYSFYAIKAWRKWCKDSGVKDCAIPYKKTDKNAVNWQQFRAESLIFYLNRVYNAVKSTQKKFVPLSHKIAPYFMLDAYAPYTALHPTRANMQWDFVAADIYNFTPQVYGILRSYRKPILLAETNTADTYTAVDFFKFLILQYLNGASIQTLFRWNGGKEEYDLQKDDGTLKEKATTIKSATTIIRYLKNKIKYQTPVVAAIIPEFALLENAEKTDIHQDYYADFILQWMAKAGETDFIFSDEILFQKSEKVRERLSGYKTIYFNNPGNVRFKKDLDILNAAELWNWVKKGGKIILSPDYQQQKPAILKHGKGVIQFCEFEQCD